MIIQGPVHPIFLSNRLTSFRCIGDSVNGAPPVTRQRIDMWVRTGIGVKGHDGLIVIKTHTHGATAGAAVLGDEMDHIFNYLETRYNDGLNYTLHYVTARELYNILKACEVGELLHDPDEYRDYTVRAPEYDSSPLISEASEVLKKLVYKTYRG